MGQETPFILEGDQIMREGESRLYALTWNDFTTMSSGGCEAYVNGSSDSNSVLSGSTTITGNVLTGPIITIPTGFGGLTVVIEPTVHAGGAVFKTGIVIHVLKPGAAA